VFLLPPFKIYRIFTLDFKSAFYSNIVVDSTVNTLDLFALYNIKFNPKFKFNSATNGLILFKKNPKTENQKKKIEI